MKRKIIFYVLLCIVSFTLVIGISLYYSNDDTVMDSYDESVIIINQNSSSNVCLYGEMIEFRESFHYNTVNKLDIQNFIDPKSEYNFLVVNDSENSVQLSDKDLKIIKKALEENKLNFYYFGENFEQFCNVGILDSLDNFVEDESGFAITQPMGKRIVLLGLWNAQHINVEKSNNQIKGTVLLYSMVDDVINFEKNYQGAFL